MTTNSYLSASPFGQWLSTNDCSISVSEAVQVNALIQSYLSDLEALDSQITAAQSAFDQSMTEHAQVDKVIAIHQQLIHPVRLIPREVLEQIFIHSLPRTHLPVISTSQVPLSLTQVCRIWRAVALSTPSLWSSVHIPIPQGQTTLSHLVVTRNRKECLTWWLDRAVGREPLSISLYWPRTLQGTFGTRQDFPRAILTYSHHIRELELNLPEDNLRLIMNTEPEEWPVLEKVAIRLPTLPGDPARGVGVATASIWRAPMVKSVVWESVDDSFFHLPIKFERLTEVAIFGSSNVRTNFTNPLEFLIILFLCPNVESFQIQLTDEEHGDTRLLDHQLGLVDLPDSTEVPDYLPLSQLTSLDLSDMLFDLDEVPFMLEVLHIPALTTVKYCLVDHSPPLSSIRTHPFLNFLRNQPGPILITTWMVDAKSIWVTQLIECLKLMPLLKTLWVKDDRLRPDADEGGDGAGKKSIRSLDDFAEEVAPDDDFLQELTSETLCPRLEELRLDRAKCSLDGIRDFVQIRLTLWASFFDEQYGGEAWAPKDEGVAKIKRLHIGLGYPRPPSDVFEHLTQAWDGQERLGSGRLEADLKALGVEAMILFSDDK